MGTYSKGDHVKVEFVDKRSGKSEWMWILVDSSDDNLRLVFGHLDSEPVINTDVRLGQQLAVSYDNIQQHLKKSLDQ